MRQLFLTLLAAVASSFFIATSHADIKLVQFAGGFSAPVDIANAGDGSRRMFVVQQGGLIRVVQNGIVQTTPFLDLSGSPMLIAGGERGLLGLAFHPQYASNGFFFVYFTAKTAAGAGIVDGDIVIARYKVSAANPNVADASSYTLILTIPHRKTGFGINDNHNGGALRFGPDGFLYAGTGDGGSGGDPFGSGQDRNVLLGKIIRINVTGVGTYTIPATNPYPSTAGIRPEIWAYGVRNPWRFSFDRQTGDFYIGDVGQGDWEEVNRQAAGAAGGANYGWNTCEGNHKYPPTSPATACVPPANYVAPILEYDHTQGIAVTGGYVYRGGSSPDILGRYVFGDYSSKLWHAAATGGAITPITGLPVIPAASTFGEGETGELYVANINSGIIYSFSSSGDTLPDPVIFNPVSNVVINSLTTSNLIKITGLGVNSTITVSNGEYTASTSNSTSCSNSWTSASPAIATDTYICVRHNAAAAANTTKTTTLTVGTATFTFVSTTAPPPPTFTVTSSIVGNGSLSPLGAQTVNSGASVHFSVTPNAGNTVSMGGTCGGVLNGLNYDTNAVTADCTVIATFSAITYAVTPSAGANGSITPNSVQQIAQGATGTFTVTPNAGFTASVGGTCGGNLAGNTYTTVAVTAACTVSATFTAIPAVPPGAPTIGVVAAGDTTANVFFSAPASNGGSPITKYTATCGAVAVDGAQSPILVGGLVNGNLYSCSVTATNIAGTGAASSSVNVTPNDLAPITLNAVKSRKTHGSAGTFDLDIDAQAAIGGAISVEPRTSGAGHKLVFQFNVPVNSVGAITVEDAAAQSIGSGTPQVSGNEVIVTLQGLTDNQRAKVTIATVNAVNGSTLTSVSAAAGFLVGDLNKSKSVNASDISALRARAALNGPAIDLSNFRYDVNLSGVIDGADVAAAKARAGLTTP